MSARARQAKYRERRRECRAVLSVEIDLTALEAWGIEAGAFPGWRDVSREELAEIVERIVAERISTP